MTGTTIGYLRPPAVAATLGVHVRTVRRWIASGILPSVKVGGAILVAKDDLHRLLESGK